MTIEYLLFVFARILHVVCVVLWIGGVSFVTTVLIPAIKKLDTPEEKLALFERLENQFSFQAKLTTLMTGASGFYMLWYMEAWGRYESLHFWWLHMMTFIWFIFTMMLFVLEPFVLHAWLHKQAKKDPVKTFSRIYRVHIVLLTLSLIAVAGAVAGVRGVSPF